MPNYIVNEDFDAIHSKSDSDKSQNKHYRRGDTFNGKKTKITISGKSVDAIINSLGYTAPVSKLIKLVYSEDVASNFIKSNAKIKSMANGNLANDIMDMSRRSATGALIGGALGFVYANLKSKNKTTYSLIGGVSGGLVGYFVSKTKRTFNF